ncbi:MULTISPECIES: cytochrome ubiquinol oxidase subunit I [Persicobacter]|uniref:Cytochrome ubiquinol oxidase subunit I n=1 Tax=Persicobacter diffluens TaxID=981 RepID=A0AAN5AIJ7_9BACT|nr:cytochrome ubiquinol oxidase subunit I [Persicobacter sp. CCB-QB2]GJM59892.1 cytochrome ubiquinol oxidase subunit I [Persicobacter diffluens]
MDVELLSRFQFAFTASFHYLFPPFSIGMGLLLVIFESLYLITGKEVWERITRFWIKVFAANFSVGVATGIVLEFEFGTNWSTYARFVGDIFGSPLAAEGIFAFFLESGFLAILLFGWNRVSKRTHLFSTIMVFLGSTMSAFWIVVANSWQQTPVAYKLETLDGVTRAVITDFWGMVFNPSAMLRFEHVVVGAFLQGAFLVLSVSAYFILKKQYEEFAKKSFTIALIVSTIAALGQLAIGHSHAEQVAEYQPAKLAAYEGLYETTERAPLYLFGFTDPETQETVGLAIPGMLSFLTHGDLDAPVKGLNEFPKEEWPKAAAVFQTYHIMVGIGMLLIGLTLFSCFLLYRKQLFNQDWLMKGYVAAVVLPVIANQLGWFSAEMGRQPWVVYGLLKTKDAVSKSVTAPEVLTSLIMFMIVYALLFFVWLYVLDREIKHGPGGEDHGVEAGYSHKGKKIEGLKGL